MEMVGRPFGRLPEWAKAILLMWTLLSILIITIEPLHENLPRWFGLAIALPYAVILLLVVVPVFVLDLFRILSWPFRKAAALLRKAD
jgi:hypothetical protein